MQVLTAGNAFPFGRLLSASGALSSMDRETLGRLTAGDAGERSDMVSGGHRRPYLFKSDFPFAFHSFLCKAISLLLCHRQLEFKKWNCNFES
jgi:hypothetical protein